jgi:hypothetical protein
MRSEAAGKEGAFFAGADLFLLMLVGSQKAAGARALNFNWCASGGGVRAKSVAAAKQGQSQCNLCATHLQLAAFFGLCVRGLERARPKPGVPFFDQKRAFLLCVSQRLFAPRTNHFPPIALSLLAAHHKPITAAGHTWPFVWLERRRYFKLYSQQQKQQRACRCHLGHLEIEGSIGISHTAWTDISVLNIQLAEIQALKFFRKKFCFWRIWKN